MLTAYGTGTTVDTAVLTSSIDVYVKDANGCEVKQTVSIGSENLPVINTPASQCYTGTAVSVTVSGTGTGTLSYSKDGITYQPSPTFSLTPGSYTLYVKDGFGCVDFKPYTVAPQLTLTASPAADTACTPNTTINLSANGGTGAYTYAVSSNGGVSYTTGISNPYVTAAAGTYRFRVTDSASPACQAVSADVIVSTKATVLTLSTTKEDVKCKGDATGSITITPTSGKAPYTYSVSKGGTAVSATAVTAGLTAGTYDIVITDALGCTSASTAVVINEPSTALSASAAAPATTTCSTSAVVTVSASGGTGAYTYSFNGGGFTSVNTYTVNDNGTSDQVIAYQVKDANGCTTVSQNITVKKLNPPTGITFTGLTPITCNSTTTGITLTSVGGAAPIAYTIVSGTTVNATGASSGIFTGLLPGNYVFEVKDANGCTKQASKTIDPSPAVAVSGVKTDEKCFGTADGTAVFTVTGASSTGNYTYVLSPSVAASQITKSGNTVTVTGLSSNSYTLTVTDSTTGCSASSNTVTVGAATAITFNVSGTKTNCSTTVSTLSITAITGGSPGYTYAYAASGSTVLTAYGTGTTVDTAVLTSSIDVYVKDANGCEVKQTVSIGSENLPVINTPASQCYTGTAVSVTVSGTGTGTLSYSKDGITYQPSPTFSLTPGSYTLYVKDGFGCVDFKPYTVAPQLTLTASPAADTACTPNTTINLSANGGTGAYTYAVSSNGGVSYTTGISNPYVTSAAGTYRFRVTDSASPACQAVSADVIVSTKATVLTLSTTKEDVKCKGDATGSITITPTSGKAPYTYSVSKGGTAVSATAVTAGLTAGTYDIVITDALGCTSASTAVVINEPSTALSASAAAPATTTCSTSAVVTVSASGGTGAYTYSFNGGGFTSVNTYTVNDNGTSDQVIAYQVKDANGCTTVSQNITVKKLNPPTGITFTGLTPITCNSTTTGITLTSVGGAAPIAYTIVSGTTVNATGASSGIFTGLLPGNYVFEVKDANGCTKQASKTIDPSPAVAVSGVKTDEKCFGTADGTAVFTVTGASSTGNYTYVLSPSVAASQITKSGNTVTVTGLSSNSYTLTVTDSTTGCSASSNTVTVGAATAITFNVSGTKTNCSTTVSTLSITAITGGSPGYTYAYAASGSTVLTAYGTGTTVDTAVLTSSIDVYVKDANGCEVKQTVSIGSENLPVINTPASQCYTGTAVSVTVSGTGTGTLSYSKDGITYQPSPTFSLTPGSYTLYVKDGFGCVDFKPYTVAPQLTLTASPAADTACTPNTTINLSANGGTGAYTYAVSSNGGVSYTTGISNPYVTSAAGTYRFRVTDSASPACQAVSADVIVNTKATVLTLSTNKEDVKCKGDATGSITITPTSGKAPYTYSVTKGGTAVSATAVTAGLTAGTYDIVITDALGCTSASTAVVINEPAAALSASAAAPATTTCSTSAVVTVSASGGTGAYTYSFNGGGFTSVNTYTVNDNGTSDQVIAYQVKDANGCTTVSQNITVKKLNPPTGITFTGLTPITCNSTTTGITLTSVGGAAPIAYTIVSGTTVNATGASSGIFTGLLPGNYVFEVKDANGCTKQASKTIDPSPAVAVSGVKTDEKCFGTADGTAVFTVTGASSTGNYTYVLSPSVAASQITKSGNTVTVTGLSSNAIPLQLPIAQQAAVHPQIQ
ncbi:beta strand repeat-containing protein [Flavobacterium marginilacus]|uniref:beta strand repeat-containing protein n=1 Tax=Flavobacterium marginilacus TaxID=3003256 RepID=UPI00248EC30E|nr:SprB repeat-containing protein [Flavobacterium marginilacus]